MTDLKPFTAGYMKPPKEHRFKKGQSGNPRGRPKKSETLASITLKVLRKKIRIKGRDEKVSLTHAFALRLRDLAVQGYQPAIDILRELESQRSVNQWDWRHEDWEARVVREMKESGYLLIDGDIIPIEEAEIEEPPNE